MEWVGLSEHCEILIQQDEIWTLHVDRVDDDIFFFDSQQIL